MLMFAREPIFNGDLRVFAYQLTLNKDASNDFDACLHSDLIETPEQLGVAWSDMLEGFTCVLKLPSSKLDEPLPEGFSPADTLLELDGIEEENEVLEKKIAELKKLGYRIIASDNNVLTDYLISHVDYLKVNINRVSPMDVKDLRSQTINPSLKLIITNVMTHELFVRCKEIGFDYYQGYFFLSRKFEDSEELPANKVAMLNLVSHLGQESLDFKAIRKVFEHDATLSYLLMRFINNPLVNKSHEISSIKHALAYLGEVMLRKFVAIVSLAQMNEGNTSELLHVALVRAKFSESIAQDNSDSKEEPLSAFLSGLFSLIDVILDRDMESLMEKVLLAKEIKTALLQKEGRLYEYIQLCHGIEAAHWDSIQSSCTALNYPRDKAQRTYIESVRWANSFSIPLSKSYPVAKP